ncbi:hypothetical protein LTS08_001540 [Lithohypha guttulata]|uniref:Uncharacterized protein n=1 Tax=Lithohypha guttulata TaxID=1690604 RepID=A0AAN7SVD1_9EURO|nr:hypothetical protein LTR51_003793 [Lithohypha guttulata]KAK5082296.1 hypothetical protein LTR05_007442 [Lithohypha guttulata]KAK5105265.1 hypothetical protein LTS08_001540 [Lithohypha guttulata]
MSSTDELWHNDISANADIRHPEISGSMNDGIKEAHDRIDGNAQHTLTRMPVSQLSIDGEAAARRTGIPHVHTVSESHQNNNSTKPPSHFPIVDLPLELQRLIFYHYLGGPYDITLENKRINMLCSRFLIFGIPSNALLLTCRHFNDHAGPMRKALFTGRLVLHSVFILVDLNRRERFEWLRKNIQCLHFSDSSVHPERWSRYFDSLTSLRRLEINFPIVKRLRVPASCVGGDEEPAVRVEDLLMGREDALLLANLDPFQMALVESLSSRRLEVVVTQKYACGRKTSDTAREVNQNQDGVIVVEIKLNENGAQIMSRRRGDCHADGTSFVKRHAELVRANGNVIDEGSHRSIWEWYSAMNS